MKPFEFLKERVTPDVQSWFASDSNLDSPPYQGPECRDIGSPDVDSEIESALEMAFDHDDPAARGEGWSRLAGLRRRAELRIPLVKLTRHAIIARFPVAPEGVTNAVVEAWLDGIGFIVDSARSHAQTSLQASLDQRVEQFRKGLLERNAGDDLATLTSSIELSLDFLGHENARRRVAALTTLLNTAEGRSRVATRCAEMAIRDDDLGVRVTAVRGLTALHKGTQRPEVLRLLGNIVGDDSAPVQLRDMAYEGLYEVSARPVAEWPIMRSCQGSYSFPADVDWAFVSGCRLVS